MSGRIDLKSVRLKTAQKYSNWLLFYLFFQKQAPFSVPSSPYRGQKPSLPLRKAPPLISVFFNGLYTPFGSPVSGGQKPHGRRGKPPYSAVFSKITPSLFALKEGSISHPDPLSLRGEGGNRPTRCSEPLRSKDGGASKPSPNCAGWDRRGVSGDYLWTVLLIKMAIMII